MPKFLEVSDITAARAYLTVPKVVDVTAYGAVGDGTTDDATAINAALNSATNVNVHFPPGTYRLGAPLLKTGGRLRIHASGATLKPTDSYTLPPSGSAAIVTHDDPVETIIDGLVIDGNSTAINNGSAYSDWTNFVYAISVSTQTQAIGDAARVVIRNCHVKNYPSAGISVAGVSTVHIADNFIEDGMYHGIALGRTTGSTAGFGWIKGNRVVGRGNLGTNDAIGGIGIIVNKFNNVAIIENQIEEMSDTGAKTEGCNDVLFRGNCVRDSGKDGIKVQSYSAASPVYAVTRAIIDNNTVERINAWRSDGGSLILANDLTIGVVSNNLLVGGGTRVADAIRIVGSDGASYTGVGKIVVSNNVATDTLNRGVVMVGGTVGAATDMSVIGNRFTAPIVGLGQLAGTFVISKNAVTVPSGTSASTGIAMQALLSGSCLIDGNHIADYTVAVSAYLIASAQLDNLRIINNSVEGCNSFFTRVDCLVAGAAARIELLEISNNAVSNPTSGGATVVAPWRIGLANQTIDTVKINGNCFLSNSATGTYSYIGEFTGTPATAIELLESHGNTYTGAFTNNSVASLTYGTVVKRALGYRGGAAPAAGTWARGDRIENGSPSELGSSPDKYVITGWRCVVAGTPGTWVQERTLTGN